MNQEPSEPSAFEKFNNWRRESATLKLLSITIILLLLLIPVDMVERLISERQWRKDEAVHEVSNTWGHAQTITGPVLTIPYYSVESQKEANGFMREVKVLHYAHFLPDELSVNGEVLPEIRKRGIYQVPVYTAQLHVEGAFPQVDFSGWDNVHEVLWKSAFVSMGIEDMRAIRDHIVLNWNGRDSAMTPGVTGAEVMASGVSCPVDIPIPFDTLMKFNLQMKLGGTGSLMFTPLGKETNVHLHSTWNDPKFTGAFLPVEHKVDKSGFDAHWKVLYLNRNYPQRFTEPVHSIDESTFGVNLLITADHYQRNERTAKYAVLFISLTFLVFFFIQVMNRVRIHIVQYILVGLALCLFYVLLLSLSEHIGFNMAYLLASLAVLAQVCLFFKSVVASWKLSGILALAMAFVYAFIYVIIQLEDLALLAGAIGLFVILGVFMYMSRKVNWYGLGRNSDQSESGE